MKEKLKFTLEKFDLFEVWPTLKQVKVKKMLIKWKYWIFQAKVVLRGKKKKRPQGWGGGGGLKITCLFPDVYSSLVQISLEIGYHGESLNMISNTHCYRYIYIRKRKKETKRQISVQKYSE